MVKLQLFTISERVTVILSSTTVILAVSDRTKMRRYISMLSTLADNKIDGPYLS